MKIAYLIMAHDNPLHLQRLIKALTTESSLCFINLDKKANLRDFKNVDFKSISFIEERIPVYRSCFSQIEAILISIRAALQHPTYFDRFVLLSGTDYPLHTASYIEDFFRNDPSSEFMNICKSKVIMS